MKQHLSTHKHVLLQVASDVEQDDRVDQKLLEQLLKTKIKMFSSDVDCKKQCYFTENQHSETITILVLPCQKYELNLTQLAVASTVPNIYFGGIVGHIAIRFSVGPIRIAVPIDVISKTLCACTQVLR